MAHTKPSDKKEHDIDRPMCSNTKYVHSWINIWTYLQCYFINIASILGTGVLGLPVTVSDSGFQPFLVCFMFCFFIQALGILYFTDLLQRGQTYLLNEPHEDLETVPLNELNTEDNYGADDPTKPDGSKGLLQSKYQDSDRLNLHYLFVLFLPKPLPVICDVIVLLVIITLMISYSLAGSEAFAQLLGIKNYVYAIPFFNWILAFVIVFASNLIKPTVSMLTIFKASLLIIVVGTTTRVGLELQNSPTIDFHHIGSSFLMSIVSLGGSVNVLPFLYNKIEPVKEQVQCFFLASFGGMATCVILNICWVYSILQIVPQTDGCSNRHSHHLATNNISVTTMQCNTYSLEKSKELGEISTIPLTAILLEDFPAYNWVGDFIQIFIVISITVSYLTFGSALIHLLGGIFDAVVHAHTCPTDSRPTGKIHAQLHRLIRVLTYLCGFLIIFIISMLEPMGFIVILEFATTVCLNLEAIIVIAMLKVSRQEDRNLEMPWKIPNFFYHFQYLVAAFSLFAIGYAIVKAIHSGL